MGCVCTKVYENNMLSYKIMKEYFDDNGIDENEGLVSFVDEYAWIMRATYCSICNKHKKIDLNDNYEFICEEKHYDYLKYVIKICINTYKSKKQIQNDNNAIEDFLQDYWWIIKKILDQK
jgi:hypothetical protein